jgi:nitrogenase iron protein
MKRIAVYGKGGIGKSTLAANLSAALCLAGFRVLQVGCDPKQDSTRLLLRGKTIATALDYLRRTPPGARRLEAIVHEGFAGVSCVEAGGPEPGVGCAGRGILSTFDLLEELGIERLRHDFVLYDVLGDVVCGGFAVPLRDEYAELVFIVTSGEFMALYAANNILKGIRNYEGRGPCVGGILFNERGLDDETGRVERFSEAVKLPIVARFPRSACFSEAERVDRTIVEYFPESDIADGFRQLAAYVSHDPQRLPACPLAAGELEQVVHGRSQRSSAGYDRQVCIYADISPSPSSCPSIPAATPARIISSLPGPPPKRYCSKGVRTQSLLFGCAFNGAVHTVMQIRNAASLVHGPRSCAYLSSHGMVSAARRVGDHHGMGLDPGGVPHLHCSHMDEHTVIFGGNAALEEAVRRVAAENSAPLFVVTTCAAGIIGEDARLALKTARQGNGTAPILLIPTDGDITGDYMQGVLDAMRAVAAEWIDLSIEPEADTINVVAEKNLSVNTEENFEVVRGFLNSLGIRVNCRFIRGCTTAEIAGFKRGRLNLLASDDAFSRVVRDFLTDHCGASFASCPFPVGFQETSEWLREVARYFHKTDGAEAIIEQHRIAYEAFIARLRPGLQGKRIFIAAQNHRIDWVLDTALDLGMEVLKVGILESVWDDSFLSRYAGRVPLVFPYPREQREEDMRALDPDLTLVNHPWRNMPEGFAFDHISVCPDVGFFSGVAAAGRWLRLMKVPAREGWRRDV